VGTPDVVWASRPASGVFELKVIHQGNRVKFTPGQIPWLLDWVEQGGRGHVIVWHHEKIKVVEGARVEELNAHGIVMTPHATCTDWLEVLGILKA